MISYREALAVLQAQEPFSPASVPIADACGQISAQAIESGVHVPPFANSSMDGFAVRSADTTDASEASPISLPVRGSTVAGDAASGGAEAGAWEIMTGAPLLAGYDAVVKVEDVIITELNARGRPETIRLNAPVALKSHIREAGEDIRPGDPIVNPGALMTPFHVMALASIGQKDILTMPKVKISVLCTGREIIDAADTPLQPGQIRNASGPYLMAALAGWPVEAHYGGVIADEPDIFEGRIHDMLPTSNLILSTGAVSAGRHDFIPDSLRKLGAEILFHKVAIRPGKPILYARFPDGTHYLGLPGNPVSTAVGLRFFAVPLLRHLLGMGEEQPIQAKLTAPHHKNHGLRFFAKTRIFITNGVVKAEILQGQESFKIQPLLNANSWAVFAEAQNAADAGESIPVYPHSPWQWQGGVL